VQQMRMQMRRMESHSLDVDDGGDDDGGYDGERYMCRQAMMYSMRIGVMVSAMSLTWVMVVDATKTMMMKRRMQLE